MTQTQALGQNNTASPTYYGGNSESGASMASSVLAAGLTGKMNNIFEAIANIDMAIECCINLCKQNRTEVKITLEALSVFIHIPFSCQFKPNVPLAHTYVISSQEGSGQSNLKFEIQESGEFISDCVLSFKTNEARYRPRPVKAEDILNDVTFTGQDRNMQIEINDKKINTIDNKNKTYSEVRYRYFLVHDDGQNTELLTKEEMQRPDFVVQDHVAFRKSPAEWLLHRTKVEMNGNEIDDVYYSPFNKTWNKIFVSKDKQDAYDVMVGNTPSQKEYQTNTEGTSITDKESYTVNGNQDFQALKPETQLMVPLRHYFCWDYKYALPTAAVAIGQRKLDVELNNYKDMYVREGRIIRLATVTTYVLNDNVEVQELPNQAYDVEGAISVADNLKSEYNEYFSEYVTTDGDLEGGDIKDAKLLIRNIYTPPRIYQIVTSETVVEIARPMKSHIFTESASQNTNINSLKFPTELLFVDVVPTMNRFNKNTEIKEYYWDRGDVMVPHSIANQYTPSESHDENTTIYPRDGLSKQYLVGIDVVRSVNINILGQDLVPVNDPMFSQYYLPYNQPGLSTQSDPGSYVFPIKLGDIFFDPETAGNVNLSRLPEIQLKVDVDEQKMAKFAQDDSQDFNKLQVAVGAIAINFLVYIGGSVFMRFAS